MTFSGKTNWAGGQDVTSDDLNRIEQGILDSASGGGGSTGVAAAPTGNTTTDTATILSASSAGLSLAAGDYVVTALGLNLAAGVPLRLRGQGSGRTRILFPSNTNEQSAITCSGSAVGGTYALASNAALGSVTITLSPANASALNVQTGDYLHLWTNLLWPTTVAQSAVHGEIVRVQSIDTSTGIITLYGPLDDAYATADAARVRKLSMLEGCYLEGLTLECNTPLAGNSGGFACDWTRGLRTSDLVVKKTDRAAVELNDSIEFDINVSTKDLADDAANDRFGYSVLAFGACQSGRVYVLAERGRHAFTTGGSRFSDYATNPAHCGVPRHIDVFGVAREMTNAAWDTHSEGDDIRFWVSASNCKSSAFQARAPNTKLMAYDFVNNQDAAIYVHHTANGFRAKAGYTSGTRTGNGVGIAIDGTLGVSPAGVINDIVIEGFRSDTDLSYGVYMKNATNVTFVNPSVKNPQGNGNGDGFYIDIGCSGIVLVDPVIDTALSLVDNQSGNADAVHIEGIPVLINTGRILHSSATDTTPEARRRAVNLVNSGLTQKVLGIRRDNYTTTRDTGDRLQLDSSGQIIGGDGAGTYDTYFWRRAAKQWGVIGEHRYVTTADSDTAWSTRHSTDTTTRVYLTADGRLFAGTGAVTAPQAFDADNANGEFEVDKVLIAASGLAIQRASLVTTTPYAATAKEGILPISTSGGAKVVNLPAAPATNGRLLTIKDESGNAATNNITINRNGTETIDGATSYVINTNYGFVTFYSRSGTGWAVIGK